ncbi:GerMN domain-containing protein [Blautia obeum]|uniref:GerMN domain-containing protein n=1 Tax=Blautia obeum TaxID=40520 RepID=UPI002A7A9638|nr:GerMN domain-containing protein [Lachnospiraceae bacterium]MDY4206415.1 GerMN domain-containing protein [Lachnospiraceae bacterium]
MKKKMTVLLIVLVGMMCLTACSKSSESQETTVQEEQEKEDKSDSEEVEDASEEKEDPVVQESEEEPEDEPGEIQIYYCNEDATAFTSEEVQIDSLFPEAVLNALIEKGAIAADVEVMSLETTTVDGKQTLLLDLNDAFASYISSMGSTGEYFVMGSICNTFLDAYDCDQIQITVGGDTLSTGHAEYPGYMSKFE